ncbi:hypothetical protein [Delftia acidovorans]|uniref:hypothetical protein n=1 Tax=Delftia acidovorans TaxID=80866 RepID=UPI00192A8A57|nr:hypothetical protein [Delftia acidovorans]
MPDSPDSSQHSSVQKPRSGRPWLWAGLMAAIASLVTACKSPPGPSPRPDEATSSAQLQYRKVAANHLYARNAERIYKGQLPPMLYAIGVLQVQIDRNGQVQRLHWMRAPSHAPEVVSEIERLVRAAAPFPAPAGAARITYTDTWLWDKSGRFQLDTLTEGQL